MTRNQGLLAGLAMMSALAQPGPRPSLAQSGKEHPSVILITMEATRADHVGCYAEIDRSLKTPALDQIAGQGALMEQAIVTAPSTVPSLASLFTSQYPPRTGVHDETGVLGDARRTLAEHLKAQGYATAAAVANSQLAGPIGLKRGFDVFDAPATGSRAAKDVADSAMATLDKLAPPYFLWVHFDDARAPYTPPEPYAKPFAGHPYDGEIASVDAQVQRIVDQLRARNALDRSILVVAGTEGEGLGEHGEDTHGLLLYDTTIRVPLLVRYPLRVQGGMHVKDVVSLVDVVPTVLELSALPAPAGGEGKSFVSGLGGAETEREAVYAESLYGDRVYGWAPLHVWRSGRKKLIDVSGEVYDTRRDPSETINMADQDKSIVAPLRAQLLKLRKAIGDTSTDPAAGSRRDPKAMVSVHNAYASAQQLVAQGKTGEALSLLHRALAKDPTNKPVQALLSSVRGQGAPTEAINTFANQWNLGNSLTAQGKLDEAIRAFRNALALNPDSAEAHFALGNVLLTKGETRGAETELRAAVAKDPKMAEGWNQLGIVLDKAGRRSDARAAFAHALEAEPGNADALFNKAKIEMLDKKLVDARRDLDRLLKAHPDYAPGVFLEAHLCTAEKNPAGAKAALTKFLALPDTDPGMKSAAQGMLAKMGG